MADYHRMSRVEKLKAHHDRMRAPSYTCRVCGVQMTLADRERHRATTCSGRREPHPLDRWVTWKEALQQGVLPGTLSRWVRREWVRARGETWKREYLLRDIVDLLDVRGSFRTETVSTRKLDEVAVDTDQGEGIEE